MIDSRNAVYDQSLSVAKTLLIDHIKVLHQVAEILMEEETIHGQCIQELPTGNPNRDAKTILTEPGS